MISLTLSGPIPTENSCISSTWRTPRLRSEGELILEILNFLFNPELIDGELEVRTIESNT